MIDDSGTVSSRAAPDLSLSLGPLRLEHPLVNASGTMEILELPDSLGPEILERPPVAAYVPKTILLAPHMGNPPPRILETPAGMINSIGLAGEGLEVFLSERLPALLALPCPLLLSIGGFALEEYVSLASRLRAALEQGEGDWSTRVGLELNISCPNIHSGCVSIGSDARETGAVVEAVRSTWPGLLVVKLTPNVTDISTIALAAVEAGADAVAAVNTFKGMAIDRATLRPYLGNKTGGVSGPAIKPLALRLVYELFESVDVPIIGIGGVACVQDVLDFMACGARVVAVGSSAFRDPWIIRSLVAELADELVVRGTTLADLVGCAHEEHTLGCTSA